MGACITAVTCDTVGHPQNGDVSYNHSSIGEFAYKSTCHFTCAEGFGLQGPAQIECTAQGQWTQQAPVCKGKPERLLSLSLSQRALVFKLGHFK